MSAFNIGYSVEHDAVVICVTNRFLRIQRTDKRHGEATLMVSTQTGDCLLQMQASSSIKLRERLDAIGPCVFNYDSQELFVMLLSPANDSEIQSFFIDVKEPEATSQEP